MNIYDFTVKNNLGQDVSLKDYQGKVLLVINTATKCGQTPQYEGLQKLYEKHKEEGFEILDFPSNQFLEQAPGTDAEINEFCTLTYGTTFPRFSKIEVNGENPHPLYAWLKKEKAEDVGDEESDKFEQRVAQYTPDNKMGDIKWNFSKFLVDQKGNVVSRFSPAYSLEKVEEEIEDLIG